MPTEETAGVLEDACDGDALVCRAMCKTGMAADSSLVLAGIQPQPSTNQSDSLKSQRMHPGIDTTVCF